MSRCTYRNAEHQDRPAEDRLHTISKNAPRSDTAGNETQWHPAPTVDAGQCIELYLVLPPPRGQRLQEQSS